MTKLITIDQIREIEFGSTTKCNAGCPLCARHMYGTSTVRPGLAMNSTSLEIFNKIIKELGPRTEQIKSKFGGTAGDIIAHPQALDLVTASAHAYNDTDLDTNGGAQSKQFWTALGKLPRTQISFSIDGLADTHSLYRINTDYHRTLENAQAYIDAGGKAKWKFIIFEHNQHQVDEARELAKAMGFARFDTVRSNRFVLPQQSASVDANSYSKKINSSIGQDVKQNGLTINPTKDVNRAVLNHYSKPLQEVIDEFPEVNCKTTRVGYLYVDEIGKLWPCCFLHASYITENPETKNYWETVWQKYGTEFNNIANNTIEEILQHEWFSQYLPNGWTDPETVCMRCLRVCAKNKEFSITDRTAENL